MTTGGYLAFGFLVGALVAYGASDGMVVLYLACALGLFVDGVSRIRKGSLRA